VRIDAVLVVFVSKGTVSPPNDLRFCCRGVRRSRATQQKNIPLAAASRIRPGQQQARVRRPLRRFKADARAR
jgi:hypothetical protein